MPPLLLGERSVTLLRGRRDGLEVTLSPYDLAEGFAELQARLTEQPSFYRGASAVVNFGAASPSSDDLSRLRDLLEGAGIALRGVAGFDEGLESLAEREGLAFESPRAELERRRAMRPREAARLSDAARSLVADFAGARDDIAQRRRRGEASVPRQQPDPPPARPAPALHAVEAPPATLYHAATLRGGQVLHHTGNIVVVGDVNPGAELLATGDILVFGRLAGIAHAGAQGDDSARIYALDLAPTQLRIATSIAADAEPKRRSTPVPEAAVARDGRIVVLALDRLGELEDPGAAST
jgi:septum site-determining protein MinC